MAANWALHCYPDGRQGPGHRAHIASIGHQPFRLRKLQKTLSLAETELGGFIGVKMS